MMIMDAPVTRNILARVVRQVIPPGGFLPRQEYLRLATPDEPWVLDRIGSDVFPWEEADKLAREMTTPQVHVFPVVLQGRSEPAMPARVRQEPPDQRQDWHEGKPNCGIE